jgi:hypothetical protein
MTQQHNKDEAVDDAANFVRTPCLVSENALEEIRSYRLLRELGRADEAVAYLVDSYRILAADQNADAGPRTAARDRVVRFYTERAQQDRLRALMDANRARASSAANRDRAKGLQLASGGRL